MLSEQDVTRVRKLKDDLDREEEELKAAIRETANTRSRLRQVRSSIRVAARTRFTTWLTNSDPEEHRRYRAAMAEDKAQNQLVKDLRPRVAAREARITAAVEECLAQSDQTYQGIMTQRRKATDDLEFCEGLRARSAGVRGQVDAALAQARQLSDRDAKDTRKALDPATAEITAAVSALKQDLTAVNSRMRAYGSFSARHVQNLRAEFSGRRADLQTRGTELMNTRAALDSVHNALTSACKAITKHRRDLDRKRNAIVQEARAQALGS